MVAVYNKILKVYELSVRGIDGEKESAIQLLNKLLDKHGLIIYKNQNNETVFRNVDDDLEDPENLCSNDIDNDLPF